MKVILKDVDPDDLILAIRVACWMIGQQESQKSAIMVFDGPEKKLFYVCRNKASITVRPC